MVQAPSRETCSIASIPPSSGFLSSVVVVANVHSYVVENKARRICICGCMNVYCAIHMYTIYMYIIHEVYLCTPSPEIQNCKFFNSRDAPSGTRYPPPRYRFPHSPGKYLRLTYTNIAREQENERTEGWRSEEEDVYSKIYIGTF